MGYEATVCDGVKKMAGASLFRIKFEVDTQCMPTYNLDMIFVLLERSIVFMRIRVVKAQ